MRPLVPAAAIAVTCVLAACATGPQDGPGSPGATTTSSSSTTSAATAVASASTSAPAGVPQATSETLQLSPEEAPKFQTVVDTCTASSVPLLAGDANISHSPAALCTALGAVGLGSTGDGRAEVEQFLGAGIEDAAKALNALGTVLDEHTVNPTDLSIQEAPTAVALSHDHLLAVSDQLPVSQSYVDDVQEHFGDVLTPVDFTSEDVVRRLDEFVSENSGGEVNDGLVRDDPAITMIEYSALQFAAPWEEPFRVSGKTMMFTNFDGSVTEVPLIQDVREVDYADVDGWKAVRLPYADGFTATFVLPNVDTDEFTPETRTRLLEEADPASISLQLPRSLWTSTRNGLAEPAGVGALATSSGQPLADVAGDTPVQLDDLAQVTSVGISEAGTGTAAEQGEPEPDSPRVPEVDEAVFLDRPFYMLVTHDETGLDILQAAVRQV